ncbi:MAG: oligosaccharide flippase family protein [Acidobacteriaceae bacterium]|nr:oligosaccharide flippase family protein [Acidobacteriaceae bacterium]
MPAVEICSPADNPNAADFLYLRQGSRGDGALSSDAMRGGIYLAGRYALGVVVSLGNMLVMTWWIGPHAYGVFVTAITMVALLAAIARSGIDTYLVRMEAGPDERVYGTAATVLLAISLALAAIAAAATPFLIHWYGDREFAGPYLFLLLTIPVTALTGVPMAKLERALEFRRVAAIELSGQALGLLVSAVLAWLRAGVWAPVAGQFAWQSFTLVAALVSASIALRFQFDARIAREMLSYGVGLTASLRIWQLRTLVNPLLVGRFAGPEAVAFIALAVRIAEALGTIRLAAGRMAIAALARLQSRREDFRKTLQQALYLQVLTLGSLLAAFALLGPVILPRVIGARWNPSLTLYPFVAAGVLVNSVYNLQASALFVIGRQWLVLQSYSAHLAGLSAATLFLLPRCGIAGYGWAELIACGSYFIIHRGLRREIAISYRQLVGCMAVCLPILFLFPLVTLVRRSMQ